MWSLLLDTQPVLHVFFVQKLQQWASREYNDVVGEIDLKPPHQRSSALNDLLLMLSSQDPVKDQNGTDRAAVLVRMISW